MSITRKAMWGLAAAAAIILAVFVARGFPTVDRGTEGAIGAAKKYQASNLAANDVVTGDASAQEFLQSETFDHLMKDPEAIAALSRADMRAMLRDKAVADALHANGVRDAVRSGLLNRIFEDNVARAALEDALKANLSRGAVSKVSEADMRMNIEAALRNVDARADLHPSMRADLKSAIQNDDLRNALSNDGFRASLKQANIRQAMARPELAAALNSRVFVDALGHRGFSAALASARFESALNAR